jgi:hypothetical protein
MKLPCKVVGMSNDDYRSKNDFFSRSYLHAIYKDGGEAQQWLDLGHPLVPYTNSIKVGNAFDRIVEGICMGRTVDSMIHAPPSDVLAKDGSRRGKAYEAWKAENEMSGMMDCSEDMAFQLRSMVDSLMANPLSRKLVEQTTENQVSVFFEIDGHRVKARPDGCTKHLWWDLKTTSAKWLALAGSAEEYGYFEQEWLYVAAAKAMGMEHFRMPFVFTQTFAPYRTRVFYLPEELVSIAGVRMRNTMEIAKLRMHTGVYYPEVSEVEELVIPHYIRSRYQEGCDDEDI